MSADTRTPPGLVPEIRKWGKELGFQQVGIADTDLTAEAISLEQWLNQGYHGEMEYMARHGAKRSRPGELVAGTCSVISVRMDYLPDSDEDLLALATMSEKALVSRYALGRDYHKTLRHRLQKLASRIGEAVGPYGYRVFVDSAPVLEKPLAQKAGLGWIGKHTNLINRRAGSWFFLGEIYTDLKLPADEAADDHCGSCRACLDICPTQAIVAPYVLDARRCISYLTIELKGAIPEPLRPLMGNHIYGCDDCQAVCPWNRFARQTGETDFLPRHGLDEVSLTSLFAWDEHTFLKRTEGSAIRRIGYPRWLRNIAVALGNSTPDSTVKDALSLRRHHADPMVREHVEWAIGQIHTRENG